MIYYKIWSELKFKEEAKQIATLWMNVSVAFIVAINVVVVVVVIIFIFIIIIITAAAAPPAATVVVVVATCMCVVAVCMSDRNRQTDRQTES